ncbi:hypothetical protein [Aliikangiella sp. IMCC44359]|uniref:hypothetical protein n=1 Tax=Aliikangiella sp. IMCC44359 TaxID=3459125 RepID=UPI00403AB485
MKIRILFILHLLFTVPLIYLLGCSEQEPLLDEDITRSSEDNYRETVKEEISEPSYRRGEVTIKVSIKQKGQSTEKTEHGIANTQFSYHLQTTLTRETGVTFDLSNPFIFDEPDEIKSSAYSDGPYYHEYKENLPPPTINGQINYHLQHDYQTPNAIDVVRNQGEHRGEGKVTNLRIKNMRLSEYGFGYELDLFIDFSMKLKNKNVLTYRNKGPVVVEDESINNEPIKFNLYPVPDPKAVEKYPYSEIEIGFNYKKQALDYAADLQKIYKQNVKLIHQYCVGLKESSSQDSLTLTCNYSGSKFLSFVPELQTLATQPDTNITISINFSTK